MNKIIAPIIFTLLALAIIYGVRYKDTALGWLPAKSQVQKHPEKCTGKFGLEDIGKTFTATAKSGEKLTGKVESVDCTSGETQIILNHNGINYSYVLMKDYTLADLNFDDGSPTVRPSVTPSPKMSTDEEDKIALKKTLEIPDSIEEMKKAIEERDKAIKELDKVLDKLKKQR
jgi:hypothetical protein